jgi:hypothetical protein
MSDREILFFFQPHATYQFYMTHVVYCNVVKTFSNKSLQNYGTKQNVSSKELTH